MLLYIPYVYIYIYIHMHQIIGTWHIIRKLTKLDKVHRIRDQSAFFKISRIHHGGEETTKKRSRWTMKLRSVHHASPFWDDHTWGVYSLPCRMHSVLNFNQKIGRKDNNFVTKCEEHGSREVGYMPLPNLRGVPVISGFKERAISELNKTSSQTKAEKILFAKWCQIKVNQSRIKNIYKSPQSWIKCCCCMFLLRIN